MTVVGTFERTLQAEDAIRELQRAGINRNDISLVAHGGSEGESSAAHQNAGAGAGIGAALGGAAGLLLGLAAFVIPGAGPIIAAGPLAAALAAGGVGAATGGIIGALSGVNVPESDAEYYAEQVRRGSALLVVQTGDRAAAETARDVMNRAGAQPAQTDAAPELKELAASSRPDVPQMVLSGARLYDVGGLEFDPVKSRLQDFGKQ